MSIGCPNQKYSPSYRFFVNTHHNILGHVNFVLLNGTDFAPMHIQALHPKTLNRKWSQNASDVKDQWTPNSFMEDTFHDDRCFFLFWGRHSSLLISNFFVCSAKYNYERLNEIFDKINKTFYYIR